MRSLLSTLAACATGAMLVALPAAAGANGETWLAASESRLESMRGGFSIQSGLLVSFGIVRTVEINGALVSSSGFQIGDLRSISPAQAQQLASQVDGLNLVQSGPGNTFGAGLPSGTPALVIQNTLNNQQIRTLTEINAVTNGMSLLKGLNLAQSLSDALGAATGR